MLVEAVEGFVLGMKPLLELRMGEVVVRLLGDLVVELPAENVGLGGELARHFFGDAAAELAIARVGEGELLAISMDRTFTVLIDEKGFWVLLREPCRRSRGRGSENDLDVVLGREAHGTLEPRHVETTFGWLHGAPGKFTDPDDVDPGALHQFKVGLPSRFGPLLRVPCGTEEKAGLSV